METGPASSYTAQENIEGEGQLLPERVETADPQGEQKPFKADQDDREEDDREEDGRGLHGTPEVGNSQLVSVEHREKHAASPTCREHYDHQVQDPDNEVHSLGNVTSTEKIHLKEPGTPVTTPEDSDHQEHGTGDVSSPKLESVVYHQTEKADPAHRDGHEERNVQSSDGSDDDFFDAEEQLDRLGGSDAWAEPEEALKFKTAREGDLLQWEESLLNGRGMKQADDVPGQSALPGVPLDVPEAGIAEDAKRNERATAKVPVRKTNSELWGTFEPDSVVLVSKQSEDSQKMSTTSGALSSVSSSTSLISQQSAPPGRTEWVLFEEGSTKRSHSSMGGVTVSGLANRGSGDPAPTSKTDWVKFDSSPRPKRRQIVHQLTGDSMANSVDATMSSDDRSNAEADRHSMATPSLLSSHGSISDNQEYLPLETSSVSSTSRIPERHKWTSAEQRSFDGVPVAPPRRKSRSDSRGVSSPVPASWVKFEEEVHGADDSFSSNKSSPVHNLHGHLTPVETELASKATLPSSVILAKDATMTAPPSSEGILQDVTNRPVNNADLYFTDVSAIPSPSPANPFREDILRQQQLESRRGHHRRQGSYNPFQTDIPEETLQPPSTWQTFLDDFEPPKPLIAPSSPGNPFKVVTPVEFHQTFHGVGHQSQTVSPSAPIDEPDFAHVPSTHSVLNTKNDLFTSLPNENKSNQSKTLPTATVSPVLKVSGASALPAVESSPSFNGFVNEYPRNLEDPEQGWPLMLRYPDKKKWVGSRDWKDVHVRLIEGSLLQFFNDDTETEPFKEIPLQCNYEFTPLRLHPYDTIGEVHTIKLLYTTYKEKWKMSAPSFHSRVLVVEQLLKVGSRDYETFRGFVFVVNEALMKLSSFKGSGSHYHNDSIAVTVTDSYRALMSTKGDLLKQSVHVDIYMLAFLSGKAECAIGLNDLQMKGAEVVSKRDIIPNKTTDWIKMENIDLHRCCNKNVFMESRFITFDPIDACRFKLLSFDVRPKRNPELPLLVKAALSGEDVHITFRIDILVPARGPKQEPHHYICYDIMVRIPVPESLVNYFRRKKRIGFSSVKAVLKTADQIKKPRIKPNLLEVSIGSAKYEHAFEAIVWRIDKLPEKMTAVPATHIFLCTMNLKSGKNYSAARLAIPSAFQNEVKVDYRTHHTTASSTTVRSLAIDSDKPPDKVIRYSAQYEYTVTVENKYVMGPRADRSNDTQCAQQ